VSSRSGYSVTNVIESSLNCTLLRGVRRGNVGVFHPPGRLGAVIFACLASVAVGPESNSIYRRLSRTSSAFVPFRGDRSAGCGTPHPLRRQTHYLAWTSGSCRTEDRQMLAPRSSDWDLLDYVLPYGVEEHLFIAATCVVKSLFFFVLLFSFRFCHGARSGTRAVFASEDGRCCKGMAWA
jgi:hypothetical protein